MYVIGNTVYFKAIRKTMFNLHNHFFAQTTEDVDAANAREAKQIMDSMKRPNIPKSSLGNTPGVKWGPPVLGDYSKGSWGMDT
jgi:hypothetical protein